MSVEQERMQEQQLDRKDLKILAYKEACSQLEEQVADLRVEVTMFSNELQRVNALLAEHENAESEAEDALAKKSKR